MRELTKAFFSASWAMSLFALQQTVNLARPRKAAKALDDVADAAAAGFDGVTKAAFETGDRIQRQMVDLALCMFSPRGLDGNRLVPDTSSALRQSADAMAQGAEQAMAMAQPFARASMAAVGAGRAAADEGEGWGPMGESTAAAPPPPPPSRPPAPPPAHAQGWGPMPGASR